MTAEEKLRELSGEYEIVDGLLKAYPIKCWPMDCHICSRCGKGVPSSHWCLPEHIDLIANLVVERMNEKAKLSRD